MKSAKLRVYNTGEVRWVVPFIYNIPHKYILKDFPFDFQEIIVVMGSWAHNSNEIKVHFDDENKAMNVK